MSERAASVVFVLEVLRRYPAQMIDAAERILRDQIAASHPDTAVPPVLPPRFRW